MLYHSHSPINAALAERLITTIQILILRYCKLKNTATSIQDLDKIFGIYNQSLSIVNHQNGHRRDHDALDNFLGQYSSEKVVKKKFNAGDTLRINRTSNIF